MARRPGRRWWRASAAVAATGLLGLHLVATDAFGALTARVTNSQNDTASATLLYSHSYSGTTCATTTTTSIPDAQAVSCSKSIYPASAAGAASDSIIASGTLSAAQLTQTAAATSCGVVALANNRATANPLVVRNGTTFSTSGGPMGATAGYVTVDGAATGGYETSVVQQAQPTTSPGTYGLGIWFKTNTAAGGPLFGFGDSASNVAGSNDRILYMTAAGRLAFVYNTAATTTGTTTASYNDGLWHFAYVTLKLTGIILVTSAITVYVDGTSVATGGGLLEALSSYNGYWHLGWSPTVGGNPRAYWAGSLSNLAVFNTSPAPATLAVATSQTQYDTLTAAATERWRLNDDGTVTATVSLPVIAANNPCGYVDIKWGFTNPLSCAVTPQSSTAACTGAAKLSSFATSGAQQVSSAAPRTTQVSTITLSHDASYTAGAITIFLAGLMVYAPLTIKMSFGATQWSTTFSWATSSGSTFLL